MGLRRLPALLLPALNLARLEGSPVEDHQNPLLEASFRFPIGAAWATYVSCSAVFG